VWWGVKNGKISGGRGEATILSTEWENDYILFEGTMEKRCNKKLSVFFCSLIIGNFALLSLV
jgi:hypothetical protein